VVNENITAEARQQFATRVETSSFALLNFLWVWSAPITALAIRADDSYEPWARGAPNFLPGSINGKKKARPFPANVWHTSRFMAFQSILFPEHRADAVLQQDMPKFFRDLNLNQVVEKITAEYAEYGLTTFFFTDLHDLDSIAYRQAVMKDLEGPLLMEAVVSFSSAMNRMRRHLDEAKNLESYKYSKERRFLEAITIYCDAVEVLRQGLESLPVRSRGLEGFAAYLNEYVADAAFRSLATDARKLNAELSAVKYCVLIRNGAVTVRHYEGEQDYSTTVEATFQRFRQGALGLRRLEIHPWSRVNHIEAQILERVALLFPEVFASVAAFFSEHQAYVDQTIARFDREVQFYVAYLKYIEELRHSGLHFCYPELSAHSKEINAENSFDLALSVKLIAEKKTIVANGFFLQGSERVFVVSGPNQGGKTTFARMIGQLHFLASLGCLVPGTSARLLLVDRVFTHFEREEQITTMVGKLQDDLNRIREILEFATGNSLIIMNETFSSTTLNDALLLSRKTMERISELDALCVWVTFLDELASFNEKTVSEVSTVRPENPATRTFKLERRHPDGLAYALALAEKHRVTYRALKERIRA